MKKVNSFHLHTPQWYTPKEVITSFLFFFVGDGMFQILSVEDFYQPFSL